MSRNRQSLRERREELQRRAAADRDQVAAVFGEWQRPIAAVDRGIRFVRGLSRGVLPIAIGVGVTMLALAVARRRESGDWLRRVSTVWRVAVGVRRILG